MSSSNDKAPPPQIPTTGTGTSTNPITSTSTSTSNPNPNPKHTPLQTLSFSSKLSPLKSSVFVDFTDDFDDGGSVPEMTKEKDGNVESLPSVQSSNQALNNRLASASAAGTATASSTGNPAQRVARHPHPAINLINYSSDSDILMSNTTRKQLHKENSAGSFTMLNSKRDYTATASLTSSSASLVPMPMALKASGLFGSGGVAGGNSSKYVAGSASGAKIVSGIIGGPQKLHPHPPQKHSPLPLTKHQQSINMQLNQQQNQRSNGSSSSSARSLMLFRSTSMVELPKWSQYNPSDLVEPRRASKSSNNSPGIAQQSMPSQLTHHYQFGGASAVSSSIIQTSNTPPPPSLAIKLASPLGKDATDPIFLRKKSLPHHYHIKITKDSPNQNQANTTTSASTSTCSSPSTPNGPGTGTVGQATIVLFEKLERMAAGLTALDVWLYTDIIEHSRRAKNYLWKGSGGGVGVGGREREREEDGVAVWPDWHENIGVSATAGTATTGMNVVGQGLGSTPSSPGYLSDGGGGRSATGAATGARGRSMGASPVLSPLPGSAVPGPRSLSPFAFYRLEYLQSGGDSDSDGSGTTGSGGWESASSAARRKSRGGGGGGKNIPGNLSIITTQQLATMKISPAGTSTPDTGAYSGFGTAVASSSTPPTSHGKSITRSHSDGDLSSYLRGFSDLKASLEMAQNTCNAEIRRLLEEVQEHVEKSLELAKVTEGGEGGGGAKILMHTSSNASFRGAGLDLVEASSSSLSSHAHSKNTSVTTAPISLMHYSQQRTSRHSSLNGASPSLPKKKAGAVGAGINSSMQREPSSFGSNQSIFGEYREIKMASDGPGSSSSLTSSRGNTSQTSKNPQFLGLNTHITPKKTSGTSASDTSEDETASIAGYTIVKNSSLPRSGSASKNMSHRKVKSDSFRLAADLKLNAGALPSSTLLSQPSSAVGGDQVANSSTPFMDALSQVLSLAQAILELDLSALMNPTVPQSLIQELLKLQLLWTSNPGWQLQELVVRLLIVFASVARLAEHFEEDFRSWNHLSSNAAQGAGSGKDKRLKGFHSHQQAGRPSQLKNSSRRDSQNSLKASPRVDSPLSILRSAASYSQGPDSSDMGDYEDYYSDEFSSQYSSPPKRYGTVLVGGKKTEMNAFDTHLQRESIKAFKAAVDEDQSMNVLMEINAAGQVSYISPAVQKVFQYSQMEILSTNTLLFLGGGLADDKHVPLRNPFKEAALNSARERPNLEICIDAKRADGRSIKVECHGLANYDNSTGLIQNVVWLMRPVKLARAEDSPSLLTSEFMNRISETEMIPNLDMALCNICDKSVPAIHFSIHTEICLKVHKTEMELMLLNDEMKALRKTVDEKLEILKQELDALKRDVIQTNSETNLSATESTNVALQEKQCEFYMKMFVFGGSLLSCLEQLLQIKIPKQEFLGISYDDLFDAVIWKMLNDADYYFSMDTFGFGPEFQQFGKSLESIFNQKRNQTNQLIEQLLAYLECLEAEHLLTIEIGLQAGSISNPLDTKFEVQEIGGVLVKVPLMQNLDSSAAGGKESMFFQNPYQPQSPSSPLATAYTASNFEALSEPTSPADHPKSSESYASSSFYNKNTDTNSRKKTSKPAVLRIQTDQESVESNFSRRPSRNTRMVVGDKSIEVDLESILTPSRQSANRNSILSPRTSQNNPIPTVSPQAPFIAASSAASGNVSRSSSYTQMRHGSFQQQPVGAPRGNSFQPFRAGTVSRQISFSTNPATPLAASCGSISNLSLPRTFSISSGVSPSSAVSQPNIKDYEIIKPISKGAFGSVFLAKKKISGQYFAIKVLRKADMVAKNQASNVKSERTILTQLDSPYVVKLFSTFQSKNHIYLVMEYLNGGDCAALLKSMGQLDEDWAKQYITEMVEGLSFLHERDIVHRDLKPDNMLIDVSGHIKLTDFGLSKAGFLGRRALGVGDVGASALSRQNTFKELSGSAAVPPAVASLKSDRRDSGSSYVSIESLNKSDKAAEEKAKKTAVGTPDYLAPESILGLGQGVSVDWWACGVILYEFLYGLPPFNAETPPLVFENILMHRIDWMEGELDISPEARELMEGLMCHEVEKRVGTRSSVEVKSMPWFNGTDWENLSGQKVYFVPTVKNIEDTDYFDSRGVQKPVGLSDSDESVDNAANSEAAMSEDKGGADFGEAVMKNLPLLEKANQKTMNKINQDFPEGEAWMQKRRDSLPMALSMPYGQLPHSPSMGSPSTPLRSVSPLHFASVLRRDSLPLNTMGSTGSPTSNPTSPTKMSPKKSSRLISSGSLESLWQKPPLDYASVSGSQRGSVDERSSSTVQGIQSPATAHAGRENSFSSYVSKDEDPMSSRKRSQAYLDIAKQHILRDSALYESASSFHQLGIQQARTNSDDALNSAPLTVASSTLSIEPPTSPSVLDVLIAESNPAAALVLENILRAVGCRCVRVKTGAEVVQCAMGEIKFGIIFCDVNLPVMNGDAAARMIKSTTNINSKTPFILLTASAVEDLDPAVVGEFNYVITKPVSHANVIAALKKTVDSA